MRSWSDLAAGPFQLMPAEAVQEMERQGRQVAELNESSCWVLEDLCIKLLDTAGLLRRAWPRASPMPVRCECSSDRSVDRGMP
jgi:hypothetical protein